MKQLLVEFDSPAACERAIRALRDRGFSRMEVYMPYPDKSIQRAMSTPRSPLPRFVFAAGVVGALLAYWVIWYTNVVDYPLNVGGRPVHGVPAFIPITFETMVLFAGTTTFVLGLVLGGLPRFYDPLFEVPAFERVMVDGWFLALDRADPCFDGEHLDRARAEQLLRDLGASGVHEVGGEADS